MTKKILLINDFPGYGKVAISAMTPVLVRRGYEVFSLPTMIVSNTLNYGRFASIDTTAYMKEAVQVWKNLGFCFDAVSTGFIANDEQADFIAQFCREQSDAGALIFVDPIMADNGKLYNSVTERRIEAMKAIVSAADYTVPNITEACFLTGIEYREDGYSKKELFDMARALHYQGAKSVIITSAKIKNTDGSFSRAVIGYDNAGDKCFSVGFDEIPIKINGSGDTFSAVMMAEILNGSELENAVKKAVNGVSGLILENLDIAKEYNGLPIEKNIEIL